MGLETQGTRGGSPLLPTSHHLPGILGRRAHPSIPKIKVTRLPMECLGRLRRARVLFALSRGVLVLDLPQMFTPGALETLGGATRRLGRYGWRSPSTAEALNRRSARRRRLRKSRALSYVPRVRIWDKRPPKSHAAS